VAALNESQQADHAYQEQRLDDLIAERDKLPPGSDQLLLLHRQINNAEDISRSYRIVKAMENLVQSGAENTC
jgi:hypothetical protein